MADDVQMDPGAQVDPIAAPELSALDLWLGEGSPAEREALRRRIAEDPLQALDMAETVALLEGFRQVRTEPSSRLHCKMADVLRRAERRMGTRSPFAVSKGVAIAACAAAATIALLQYLQPFGPRPATAGVALVDLRLAPSSPSSSSSSSAPLAGDLEAGEKAAPEPVRLASERQWESTVEQMRRMLGMDGSSRLRDALEDGLRGVADPLERWLDPRNALAQLRVEHERRGDDRARSGAVARQGGMAGADARAQELADFVARELTTDLVGGAADLEARPVALAVRALLAAGALSPRRSGAIALGSDWLAERVPAAMGADLVTFLVPLLEVAAVTGAHVDLVARHGARLVDEVLQANDDTWGRRRPDLLAGRVASSTVADAGRLLVLLPGFGVDAERCGLVRELLLGHLRERRDQVGGDGPEVLAAMLFGCVDLLGEAERDEVEKQLKRWNVTRLAPDFVTVQQIAWGFEPGRLGWTRLQRDLRRLAVLGEPTDLGGKAAFCLCLTTSYAAWRGTSPARPAHGD